MGNEGMLITNYDLINDIDLHTTSYLGIFKHLKKAYLKALKWESLLMGGVEFGLFLTLIMNGFPVTLAFLNTLVTIPIAVASLSTITIPGFLIFAKFIQVHEKNNCEELLENINRLGFDLTKEDLKNIEIENIVKIDNTKNVKTLVKSIDDENVEREIPTTSKQVIKVAKIPDKDKLKYIRQITIDVKTQFFNDKEHFIDVISEKEYNFMKESIKCLKLSKTGDNDGRNAN